MTMWVFGYGSLIWNSGFDVARSEIATLDGFARSFCMWSVHYRGTEEVPGLVLGLDAQPGARAPLELQRLALQRGLELPGHPRVPEPAERRGGQVAVVERAARQAGLHLNISTELDAMTQIKELVARGSGYSIFSPSACHDFVEAGRLLKAPIIDPVISRPVYLVRSPDIVQTRACEAVEKLTLNVADELVARGLWEGRLV